MIISTSFILGPRGPRAPVAAIFAGTGRTNLKSLPVALLPNYPSSLKSSMSCIPYNEARFRVKSESGTRHDPVKVEESDNDELVDDVEMLEEESDLTDIEESPPVAEDTAEVDEPAEEEDGPARRTRSAQESPQPVKKRKRKSGFSYRQPTITPLPNIRQSDFYKVRRAPCALQMVVN